MGLRRLFRSFSILLSGRFRSAGSLPDVGVTDGGTRSKTERLSGMAPTLSSLELDLLRQLMAGKTVKVSSQLRVRLELAGVIRDGAQGIVVTAEGRRLANQKPVESEPCTPPSDKSRVAVDRRGRRMPLQRKSVF